jgi:hypothetical protein
MLPGLSALVSVLMATASALGLLAGGIYRDNDLVRSGWVGNDLATLLIAVPVLTAAAVNAKRGSARGVLICLGLLAYAVYNYAFYLFGAAFNSLFLVYVAIVVSSTFGLISGLTSAELHRIAERVRVERAQRWVGALLVAISLGLGVFWSALSVNYIVTGEIPPMVTAVDHPTNLIGALDLWLVVSFGLLGGVWLLSGLAWGYIVATIWSLQGALYMTALSAATLTAFQSGAAENVAQLGLWGPIGLACVAGSGVLIRACPDLPKL